MYFFKPQTFNVFRYTPPVDKFSDPTHTQLATKLIGDKQPISHSASTKNMFLNKNVNEVIFANLNSDIKEHDMLTDTGGVEYFIIAIEEFDSGVNPHIEIYISNQEWGTEP